MIDMKAQKLWKSWIFKVRWLTDKNFGYGVYSKNFVCLSTKALKKKNSDILNSFLIILSNKPNI